MAESKLSITRLIKADILTNVGTLEFFVKTETPDLADAKKEAEEKAKSVFVSNLVKDNSFSWALLDRVSVVYDEGEIEHD